MDLRERYISTNGINLHVMEAGPNNYEWPVTLLTQTNRPGAFTKAELEKYQEAFMQPGAFLAVINWYRAALQAPSEPPASFRITMPILILWGVNDAAIIPEQAEESLAYCDQGRLVKFKKATHWLQHEEAEKVNKLVEDFFSQG